MIRSCKFESRGEPAWGNSLMECAGSREPCVPRGGLPCNYDDARDICIARLESEQANRIFFMCVCENPLFVTS
jgi:hypothetical protein